MLGSKVELTVRAVMATALVLLVHDSVYALHKSYAEHQGVIMRCKLKIQPTTAMLLFDRYTCGADEIAAAEAPTTSSSSGSSGSLIKCTP